MKISKVISTIIKNRSNIVKVLRLGGSDVQTGYNIQPFGIDGNIPAGYRAIFAYTGNRGDKIIIGIINTKALAQVGELRLHSEKSDGSEAIAIYLKNDGTCEMGGASDNLVRYSKLEEAFNELKGKFNTFAESYSPGGPSTQGLPASIEPSNADISGAKINEIKTL
jgi:hypothetical protein